MNVPGFLVSRTKSEAKSRPNVRKGAHVAEVNARDSTAAPSDRPVTLFLTFGCALLPGLAAFWGWRGPRVADAPRDARPDVSLPERAVLRDGAVGATRWAFAAIIVKLARDGHCTLVRTRKRRWLRTGPALTVDLHANLPALSPFEQTALRQLGRHDTLGGFGFAGSTFRRRTLRDVRADLVERGWLADRSRRSNACLALGLVLLTGSGVGVLAGSFLLVAAAGAGLGMGSLLAALPRYPATNEGARRRAAYHAHTEQQRGRVHAQLSDHPDRAAETLLEALPALVLDRIATPRWLIGMADSFDETDSARPAPDWVRDEIAPIESMADACRTIAHVLRAMGCSDRWVKASAGGTGS